MDRPRPVHFDGAHDLVVGTGRAARRKAFAEQMGGTEGIDRQHRNGKLTVRERIPLLADAGSFQQFAGLRGEARYDDDGQLVGVLPDGKVEGMCRIDGRKVVVTAGDFTVRGGSASGQSGGLGHRADAPPSGRSSGACPSCGCSTPPAAACAASRRSGAPTSPTPTASCTST